MMSSFYSTPLPSTVSLRPRSKVAQQVGCPNAKPTVFIEETGLEFLGRQALDFRQHPAENGFLRTAEPVIIAHIAQRLACNGANHPRLAII